ADLAAQSDRRLRWLADQLPVATVGPDAWWRIVTALLRLRPARAAAIHRHLADEDAWLRDALGLDADRQRLPGDPECPACRTRRLYAQTAASDPALWTVVCALPGCRCSGTDCPCGMAVRVAGVAHIWPRSTVLAGTTAAA
ncbi:hypothetical protein ACFQ0D_00470, partial [Micromonospora zhanjiangensis]